MFKYLFFLFTLTTLLSGCSATSFLVDRATKHTNITEKKAGLYHASFRLFLAGTKPASQLDKTAAKEMVVKHCSEMGAKSTVKSLYMGGFSVDITWICHSTAYYERIAQEKAREVALQKANAEAEAEALRIEMQRVEEAKVEELKWDINSILFSKGNVDGYNKLKFGLNLQDSIDVLDSNCKSIENQSKQFIPGRRIIKGISCFNVSGRGIYSIYVHFDEYRLSSVILDFNGNSEFPDGTDILAISGIALFGGLDRGEFDRPIIKNILQAINSKYDILEQSSELIPNGTVENYAFDNGTIVVNVINEYIETFNTTRDYLNIRYISNDYEIKETLDRLGLSKISKDEF